MRPTRRTSKLFFLRVSSKAESLTALSDSLAQHEAIGEERSLEEQVREVAHALVGLVLRNLLPELLDDGVGD